jgi:hypothetical protein
MESRGVVRIAFVTALAGLVLASCSSPPPHPQYPDIRFTNEPPIALAVGTVILREDYTPSAAPPHVEERFPVMPMQALENWAHDRLRASGGPDQAIVDITNASVIETALPQKTGISSWFTNEQSERYDMTIQVTINIVDPTGLVVRTATVRAARSQSVAQNISPDQRDQTWYDMTKAIMAAFDRQMEHEIRSHFTGFVTN